MTAETLLATVGGVLGLVLVVAGLAAIEAGKGGYGHGPFPMVPVPRDNVLIGLGLVALLVGLTLLWAAQEVVA